MEHYCTLGSLQNAAQVNGYSVSLYYHNWKRSRQFNLQTTHNSTASVTWKIGKWFKQDYLMFSAKLIGFYAHVTFSWWYSVCSSHTVTTNNCNYPHTSKYSCLSFCWQWWTSLGLLHIMQSCGLVIFGSWRSSCPEVSPRSCNGSSWIASVMLICADRSDPGFCVYWCQSCPFLDLICSPCSVSSLFCFPSDLFNWACKQSINVQSKHNNL